MFKKYLKKYLFKAAMLIIIVILLPANCFATAENMVSISAEGAVLLDWNTGRILYARNAHLPKPMASITKVMTAVLALEKGNLGDMVIASPRAATTGGSSIWLEESEQKSLEELLYGLMLRSGNDAAVAIAEHIAGDERSFAKIMTRRAYDLGARNTSFKNPHGLHHIDHYTTAYDFSRISAHAMGISKFREIIATEHIIISWPGHPWERHLYNQNRLLELYPGAEGIKTGWTTPAGRCFAGAAARDGRRLIVVLLNAPAMWEDAVQLLDYGFNQYSYKPLIIEGQTLKTVPVLNSTRKRITISAGKSFLFPMQEGETKNVTYRFIVTDPLYAPLKAGERVGELEINFDHELIGMVELLAAEDANKINIWQRVKRMLGRGV